MLILLLLHVHNEIQKSEQTFLFEQSKESNRNTILNIIIQYNRKKHIKSITMGAVLAKLLQVFWTKKLDIVVIGLENRYVMVLVEKEKERKKEERRRE
jgi:uncharacterized membrane protein